MEIRYPNYYKKFRCTAGECPDTCCAGWEIAVDKGSDKRYRKVRKTTQNREFGKKLRKYVKGGRIISTDVTCPFLDAGGLCEMYRELGPEALCHTCRRYPRHREDYGELHEIVLLLSCPEVVRIVLTENDGSYYVRKMPGRHGNMEGVDQKLLSVLLKVRGRIWEISRDPQVSMDKRMALSLALAHDAQRRLMNSDYTDIAVVLERYQGEHTVERFLKQWDHGEAGEGRGRSISRFLLMSDFMGEVSGLETICRDWPDLLEKCRMQLYHSKNSRADYRCARERFLESHWEVCGDLEKLFEYFVYSFVLSALYDGDILTKMKMAVLCTMAVEELYMAAGPLDLARKTDICHALARQIENSDENRGMLERFLKKEILGTRRIIDALI